MQFHKIKNLEDSMAYTLDCALATVEEYCIFKSKAKRKSEFDRHVNLAQKILDFCIRFKVSLENTRGKNVMEITNGDVKHYAEMLMKKYIN